MSDDIRSEETFHPGEETEESFHLGGSGQEENFHLGGNETEESFHLGGDETEESLHLGGDMEEFNISGKISEDDGESIDYSISEDGNSIIIDADDAAMDVVQDFVRDKLLAYGCANKAMMQIRLAVEEIFVNIISYAYRPEIGKAEVFCEVTENPLSVCIQYMDSGKPFDPLAADEADTSGAMFMEREGGFGIHLVKSTMDDVKYEYNEGKNILTVVKRL